MAPASLAVCHMPHGCKDHAINLVAFIFFLRCCAPASLVGASACQKIHGPMLKVQRPQLDLILDDSTVKLDESRKDLFREKHVLCLHHSRITVFLYVCLSAR